MMNIDPWLINYGFIAIFFLLAMGIVGLPIPDESIIILAGILVAKGKLSFIPTLMSVYLGGMVGITVSYLIGRTGGYYVINHLGKYIGLNKEKIIKAEKWFKDMGKWLLFFGYFILGIRHLAGFTAGLLKLDYRSFAIFAYSGLLIWASILFTIGYYFSHTWHQQLNVVTWIGLLIGGLCLITLYVYFFLKMRK